MQFRNETTGNVVTVFGPVADAYERKRGWVRLDVPPTSLDEMSLPQVQTFAVDKGLDLSQAADANEARALLAEHTEALAAEEGTSDEPDDSAPADRAN